MFDEILTLTALKATDVLACYAYGSRVYGTATAASDYDFIVVADAEEREINDGTMNIHVDHPDNFQRRLREHDISCMECYFLPVRRDFIFKGRPWNFELDRQQLRHAISAKASNSFVKAKKKIMVETMLIRLSPKIKR
jgi:predicted nucleotidyltransferase